MFKVVNFDKNTDADTACKELFANAAPVSKKKNKVQKGKITKNTLNKNSFKNEEKIKDEIRAILQSNVDSIHKKIKTKKKKVKQTLQQTQMVQKTKNKQKNGKTIPSNEPNLNVIKQKKGEKAKKEEKPALPEKTVPDKPTQKKKKRKKNFFEAANQNESTDAAPSVNPQKPEVHLDYKQKKREKLKEKLQKTLNPSPEKKQKSRNLSLRDRMMQKLQAARFRFINEQIYSSDSKEAQKIFTQDPEAFEAYHEGYRQQVSKWPLNPLDVIIKSIQRLPKTHTVADFGCGDATLAKSVTQKVHSFDLVAANDSVTACDMARVPLQNGSVDVVVFCLSLMGTNLNDYLLEGNRVLKPEGILKIAEVESRFDDVNQFIEAMKRFNFKNTWRDLSHNLFYFLDFKKEANVKNKKKLPRVSLRPCLYKKR